MCVCLVLFLSSCVCVFSKEQVEDEKEEIMIADVEAGQVKGGPD